ncbi:DNA gyrase/topoisomerase IV subunit A, partial [candidate division KSB1 bacterium]|nr:DNA gyrase/topoisomerase IV subunit A [candidate division KSB1 bacterium]
MDTTEQNGNTINTNGNSDALQELVHVDGLYENWFLDYASYVILERAVPALLDGLKPVQRRILHAMREMDDGRFHKVANVIGQTMQYHPHGDAAIGDALVNMGQKELLIDTQGNWGDTRTGDSAAAPRYIEARLSKFAMDVVFNPQTTEWQLSYDGRKREPVLLPVKFPLLLAQGAEGIAVGLATKIMPHNFIELLQASIEILKGNDTKILPDFPSGGHADFTNYNHGMRGGKIRVRAKIESPDRRMLIIRDIPYGTTTTSVMESIVKANDSGKIKIKQVVDNTAQEVEIRIELPSGVSPDVTIDALYAFTDCEVSISPNCCVIIDEKPRFLSVDELLRICTAQTVQLLKKELEIRLAELAERWHFSSLEKIFIENRIYRDIEECETWESVLETIDRGLDPFKPLLKREVTTDDIIRLTEIRIKRISKYNSFKADELIRALEEEMKEVRHNLKYLTEFAIRYFENLLEKYSKGRERRTEIRTFDTIAVQQVAVANEKLYMNREEGFIGYGLKKDELVSECSDIDDIIVFMANATFKVVKVATKVFVGKDIIYAAVWKKSDERMVYNMIYRNLESGKSFIKRFAVTSITRDREYDLAGNAKGAKVLYFTANPNGETEIVTLTLSGRSRARKKVFDVDFAEIAIKGRSSQGNTVTRYPVNKVVQKEVGESTFGDLDIWYDPTIGRLNTEERGEFLGRFGSNDLILALYKDGSYQLTAAELTNRYEHEDIEILMQFDPKTVITAVHYDGAKKHHFVKRFRIETQTVGKRFSYISDHRSSELLFVSIAERPHIVLDYEKGRQKERLQELVNLTEIIDIKGWRSLGNRLTMYNFVSLKPIEIHEPKKEEKPKSEEKPPEDGQIS